MALPLVYVNAVPNLEVGTSLLSLCKIILVGRRIQCGDIVPISEGLSLRICCIRGIDGNESSVLDGDAASLTGLVTPSTVVDLERKLGCIEGKVLSEEVFMKIASRDVSIRDEWIECAKEAFKVINSASESSSKLGVVISSDSGNGKSLTLTSFYRALRDTNITHTMYIDCSKPLSLLDCQYFIRKFDRSVIGAESGGHLVVFIDNIDLIRPSQSEYLYVVGALDHISKHLRSLPSICGGSLRLVVSCLPSSAHSALTSSNGLVGLSPSRLLHVHLGNPSSKTRLEFIRTIFFKVTDVFSTSCNSSNSSNNSNSKSSNSNGDSDNTISGVDMKSDRNFEDDWNGNIGAFRSNILSSTNGFSYSDLRNLENSILLSAFSIRSHRSSDKYKLSMPGAAVFELIVENILLVRSQKVSEAISQLGGSGDSNSSNGGNEDNTESIDFNASSFVAYDDAMERMEDIFQDIERYIVRNDGSTAPEAALVSISDSLSDEPPCKGMVIHGPSGCGKTALAHSIAEKYKTSFKFIAVSCAELVNKVVGESERKLTALFERARRLSPCIILLDNIDTILGRTDKHSDRHSRTSSVALDRILSTLLVEIDGVMGNFVGANSNSNSNSNSSSGIISSTSFLRPRPVVVIATTTDISFIDEALLRSGRLEEHLLIDLPDFEQRKKIIQYYISKYFCKFFDIGVVNSSGNGTDPLITIVDEVMKMSDGKSGAFIRQIIQEISMNAIRLYVSEKIASKGVADENNVSGQGRSKDGKVAVDLALIRKCIDLSFVDIQEKAKIASNSVFKNITLGLAL